MCVGVGCVDGQVIKYKGLFHQTFDNELTKYTIEPRHGAHYVVCMYDLQSIILTTLVSYTIPSPSLPFFLSL